MSVPLSRRGWLPGRRWASAGRPPSPSIAAHLHPTLKNPQPRFLNAVLADTALTAQYRGERHEFRSTFDAMVQAVRLSCITDSFFAQVCYRAEVACRQGHVPVLPAILHRCSIVCGQISIDRPAVLQPGIYIPHGQIVVDGPTLIEAGAVLRPFITIGRRDGLPRGPTIGRGARIGTGAKVLGPVLNVKTARFGANAEVTIDVPEGCTAVGVPARILTP